MRAWPAAQTRYDGAWVIRLTPGHSSNRLNSVNLLDPHDVGNLEARIRRAAKDFDSIQRPITFRISPLAGLELTDWFDRQGWGRFGSSKVMRRPLSGLPLDEAIDQIPMKDVERFSRAAAVAHDDAMDNADGLARVIRSIQSDYGLFVAGDDSNPVATVICVNEGDAAGIFNLATKPSERGRGHGRRAVLSALKWARSRGARQAWLQVEEANLPGVKLYGSLGFEPVYAYHYRRPRS